jgi:hypothetical protein
MSYIPTDGWDDAPELKTLAEGTEVKLRVKKAEAGLSSKGASQLVIVLEDPSDELVDDIYQYVTMPTDDLRASDPKKYAKVVKYLKDFLACFSVDFAQGFNTEDLIGAEGFVIVSQEEYEGRSNNRVKSYVRGK